jgi:hypothetical protein
MQMLTYKSKHTHTHSHTERTHTHARNQVAALDTLDIGSLLTIMNVMTSSTKKCFNIPFSNLTKNLPSYSLLHLHLLFLIVQN